MSWHSPRSRSPLAAAAPARLAEQSDGNARWRETAAGEIEVATMLGGRLDLHVVGEDGRTTLRESSAQSAGYRWGGSALLVGFGLFVGGAALASRMPGPAGEPVRGWTLVGLLLGMALVMTGASAVSNRRDIAWRLERLYGGGGEWHVMPKLGTWAPQTSEQLAAVEQLADQHDGLAFVRTGDARTEVAVMHDGRLDRYWVDTQGNTGVVESIPPRRRQLLTRTFGVLCAASMAAAAAFGFATPDPPGTDRRDIVVISLIGAVFAFAFLCRAVYASDSLSRRVRTLRQADNSTWLEVHTLDQTEDF